MVQFLVIAQTASFKCVKCCYFSILVACRRPCPWALADPDLEPRHGSDKCGLGLQGQAAVWSWMQAGDPERATLIPEGAVLTGCDHSYQRGSKDIGNKEQDCKDSSTNFIRKELIFWKPEQQIAMYPLTFLSADLPFLLGTTYLFWKLPYRHRCSGLSWKLPFEIQSPPLHILFRARVLFCFLFLF